MQRPGIRDSSVIFKIVAGTTLIESAVGFWLWQQGWNTFAQFVLTPDTPGYVGIAQHLAETFTLLPSPRTLGYPLFLAVGELLAGRDYGSYLAVAIQLVLNILMTVVCWKMLERLVPSVSETLRLLVTLLFFWAGLGMALFLMTDFMAAVWFGMFVYGFLFWRSRTGLVMAGVGLALATLTRPTFTFVPLLLPLAAHLVGRVSSKIPFGAVVTIAVLGLAATGASVAYQYTFDRYLGPSPILINAVEESLYYSEIEGSGMVFIDYKRQFEQRTADAAGKNYSELSPRERDLYAGTVLREAMAAHPVKIALVWGRNFLKYLLVPMESTIERMVVRNQSMETYNAIVRPLLLLICLPLWAFALAPPINGSQRERMYYWFMLLCVSYTMAVSAVAAGSGERIRFPVLMLMLPTMAWNLEAAVVYVRRVCLRANHANT
jgi:hypothetical protein